MRDGVLGLFEDSPKIFQRNHFRVILQGFEDFVSHKIEDVRLISVITWLSSFEDIEQLYERTKHVIKNSDQKFGTKRFSKYIIEIFPNRIHTYTKKLSSICGTLTAVDAGKISDKLNLTNEILAGTLVHNDRQE
jgi:hypothetical protein